MKYNIGQVLELTEDLEVQAALSDTKTTLKKGTKMFVLADKKHPQVIFQNGKLTSLPQDAEVEGFSVEGISEFVYRWLNNHIPLEDMLEEYDINSIDFKDEIMDALEELGMYDNTGNRS